MKFELEVLVRQRSVFRYLKRCEQRGPIRMNFEDTKIVKKSFHLLSTRNRMKYRPRNRVIQLQIESKKYECHTPLSIVSKVHEETRANSRERYSTPRSSAIDHVEICELRVARPQLTVKD